MEREFNLQEEVFFEPESDPSGFLTHVIGHKPKQYLLLDLPPIPLNLGEGTKAMVYCLEPPICRFETRVLRIFSDPPSLVMECLDPLTFEAFERRSSDRQKVFIRINLQHAQGIVSREGYILNISATGCFVAGNFGNWVDQMVTFSFRIPGSQEVIQGMAEVVRGEVTDKGFHCGLKFINLSQRDMKRLNQFIRTLRGPRIII